MHPRLTAALALAAAAFSYPAVAQPVCAERTVMLEHLAKNYAETPAALGLTSDGLVVELVMSMNGRTWTLIVTDTAGRSCLFTGGDDWQSIPRIILNGAPA